MNQIKNEIVSLIQKYFQSTSQETNIKENTPPKKNNYINNNNNIVYNKNNKNYTNNNMLNDENSYNKFNNSKNNTSNNYEKNMGKLFFYQFLQKEKNQKLTKPHNKSNSFNKFKPKIFNTINTTKNNFNKSPKIPGGESSRYNKSYLTQNIMNNNGNIFNRLYNDAKIKRVVYKRPCHFSNNSNDNKIFQDYTSNVYETINGKNFNVFK